MREIGATPNALLGLLSLEPMSGYDIRQMISRSIGYFWSESYGQIYPGLKRLAAEGLVVKEDGARKGKSGPACVFADGGGAGAVAKVVEAACSAGGSSR